MVIHFFLDEPKPIVSEEFLTVVKNSMCTLSFDVPETLKEVVENCLVDFSFENEHIDTFEIQKPSADNHKDEDMPVIIQKEFEEVDFDNNGLYTITLQYKKQKYVHKISVEVG